MDSQSDRGVSDPAMQDHDRPSFWKRQFAPEITGGQVAFDVVAGILLPLLCLALDPIVFRSVGVLEPYAGPAYGTMGLSFLSLAIWLIVRRAGFVMGGALAAGAGFALVVGIILLPYSVFGMLALIGVLGFSPFLTSFVYLRNSVRAFALARSGGSGRGEPAGILAAAVAFVVLLGGPWGTQEVASREVARATEAALVSGDFATSVAALERIRWLVDADQLVRRYQRESVPERRRRLAGLYLSFTGRPIEERIRQLDSD
jgi:hypothetical protein